MLPRTHDSAGSAARGATRLAFDVALGQHFAAKALRIRVADRNDPHVLAPRIEIQVRRTHHAQADDADVNHWGNFP